MSIRVFNYRIRPESDNARCETVLNILQILHILAEWQSFLFEGMGAGLRLIVYFVLVFAREKTGKYVSDYAGGESSRVFANCAPLISMSLTVATYSVSCVFCDSVTGMGLPLIDSLPSAVMRALPPASP